MSYRDWKEGAKHRTNQWTGWKAYIPEWLMYILICKLKYKVWLWK